MKQALLTAICVIAALTFGCVPSLQPLYTEKDLVLEPALAGTWVSDDSKDQFTFRPKDAEKAYSVVCTNKDGGTSALEGRLVRLGKSLFLDTTVTDVDIKNDFPKFHLLPVHLLTKITIEGDVLRFATLDYSWVKKGIAEKTITLRHETIQDLILLTASTGELQTFLNKHAGEDQAFQNPTVLRRRK